MRKSHYRRKYKKSRANKKNKCRSRRTRKMRGGITKDANKRAGITTRMAFINTDHVTPFREYHFGNTERTEKWIRLFQVCEDNNVPIFILTSGDKLGIIYSLQLMELDRYIKEVLCNRERNDELIKNNDFDYSKRTKYGIIEDQIRLRAFVTKSGTTSDGFIGYLVDDDEYNCDAAKEISTGIKFIDSKSNFLRQIRRK